MALYLVCWYNSCALRIVLVSTTAGYSVAVSLFLEVIKNGTVTMRYYAANTEDLHYNESQVFI